MTKTQFWLCNMINPKLSLIMMYDCPPKLECNSDEKVLRVTAAAASRLADVKFSGCT